ncbi:agarase [uncultured Draconibacterium sp.]|uniref:agarase n=1 Tax=uncultured Draconibacterium sp. TaxID=1573823 RepID=UPI002AA65A40|nr:agarase [uncultured Draconibacterium sp.]
MRKIFFLSLIIGIAACSTPLKKNKETPEQEYIMVDAKTRVYHDDGTRTYRPYKPFKTRSLEILAGYQEPEELPVLSKYGGNTNLKEKATGFFHVKKIGDRWWGIDPEGNSYVNIALNSLNAKGSEGMKQAMKEKFGSKENWMKETIALLQVYGFNCAGSWSDHEAIIAYNKTAERPMAYTINWNFMSSYGRQRGGTYQQAGHTGYPNDAIFVFDPDFETFCDEHAKQLLQYKDDPNLFGYFSDNEMPFKFKAIDNYLALPEHEHGRVAAENWLKEKGITKNDITDEHREEFMALVGEKYFSIVSKAIKKYDPNHMYIGARFYADEKHHEQFMRAIGPHLDIVSNNYYNHWTPDSAHVNEWTEWTGRPFIVTEYYTKGEDSGMGNISGAGWIVRTQEDRGLFYQNYNLALLESKNCVGWHYFKYIDNDPNQKGVDPSNVDANKGIVSNRYVPWTPMLDKMKELNTQVYNLVEHFDKQ